MLATYPAATGGQGDQQPLAERHVGLHGQYREHQWDIVEDGGQNADDDIGTGGAQLAIELAIHESRAKGIEALFTHPAPDVVAWARRMAIGLRATADSWRRNLEDRNERFE